MSRIFVILSSKFPEDYVKIIEDEYNELKNSYYSEDKVKVVIHAARFCEIISSLLCFKEFNHRENFNNINFNKNINRLENSQKSNENEEISRLVIPRVLRSIYTIRNKKKVAHIKKIDTARIDSKLINIAVDWVISQILIIYCNLSDENIIKFLEYVSLDNYRKVERFENGDIMFNDPKLTIIDKLLFVLADFYNRERISTDVLYMIIKPKKRSYITTYLGRMKTKNLVHIDKNGIKLTKWGIEEARKIRQSLNN